MKQAHGWFWPDGEKHLLEWVTKKNDMWEGRLAYQGEKIRKALAIAYANRGGNGHTLRTAIDVGGHIGLWSFYFASRFEQVIAFEPMAAHRACFERNVTRANVTMVPKALGLEEGTVGMHTDPTSSGDTYVQGRGDIPVTRLDDYLFQNPAPTVDLIKLDCEGYELFALQGAQNLILRDRPAIVVEQKPGKAQKFSLRETQAVDYLEALGMKRAGEMAGDFFLVWP